MRSVKNDMQSSALVFEKLVWPVISPWIGAGELLKMENVKDSNFAKLLDMKAGIDGWQIHSDGMRGIASRVQITKAWNTFTVRMSRDSGSPTEYEKRLKAITTGKYIYPYLTVQAYVKTWKGPILSVGMSKTSDIIKFIRLGLNTVKRAPNAEFAICPWTEMQQNGFRVKVKQFLS